MKGLVSPYATATMDAEFSTFYEQGANPAEPNAGLPHAGLIYAYGDPSTRFQFQSYTSNNALFLTSNAFSFGNAAVTTGTLTLAQPTAVGGKLLFAVTSADFGGEDLNLTIHFQGAPDYSTSITDLPDWTQGAGIVVAGGTGKAYAALNPADGLHDASFAFADGTPTATTPPNIPRIFEIAVNPLSGYPVTSIDVTLVPGSGAQFATAAIFGISDGHDPLPLTASSFNQDVVVEAAAGGAVPEPAAMGLLSFGVVLLSRRRCRS